MNTEISTHTSLDNRPRGVWDYVSPSRLNLWLKCPLAFKLRYIEGVPTPVAPAAFVGKMVHAGLERYYRHRQFGITLCPEELATWLVPAWQQAAVEEGAVFQFGEEETTFQQQTLELVRTYLAQVPEQEARPLAVETMLEALLIDPISGENLGIPLVGIIDLVLDEREGPLITDFKTTARGGEPLETAHEIQLSAYSYLFRQTMHCHEQGLEIRNLVKTKVPRIERYPYAARNEIHFRRLFAVIRAYLDDLSSGRFIFRPGLGCSMCDYRGAPCQTWQG